jgi:hypothetical protein
VSGATIGGVIGGIVGVWTGIGWQAGWMIGSAIGGYVDPTQVFGPRLSDTRGQTSQVGGAIPRAWGTAPVPGNIIWQQPGVTEHKHTDDGKGSGTEQVTYSYTRSYAIMFHLGEIAGVLQIKRNGKIVYDVRDDDTLLAEYEASLGPVDDVSGYLNRIRLQHAMNNRFMSRCVIYNGTQTQEPDPTIEAYLGVGNAPAYRGRAYFVVTDDETQAGEIAQYEVIVASCGTINTVDGWSEHPFNWMIQSSAAGRLYVASDPATWATSYSPGGGIDYSYVTTYGDSVIVSNNEDGVGVWARYTDDFGQTFNDMPSIGISECAPPLVLSSGRMVVLAPHATAATVYYSDTPFDSGTWTTVSLGVGADSIAGDDTCIIVTSNTQRLVSTNRAVSFGSPLSNSFTCTSVGYRGGLFVFGAGSGEMPRWSDSDGATLTTCTGTMHTGQSVSIVPMSNGSWLSVGRRNSVSTTDNIFRSADGKTGWASVTTPSMYFEGSEAQRLAERGGIVIASGKDAGGALQIAQSINYGATWTAVSHGLSGFTVEAGTGVTVFPLLPAGALELPDSTDFYTLPDGTIIYPGYDTLTPCGTTTVGEIVASVCELSGLTSDEYDVSQLTDTLDGYVIARETDAASVIESLRPVGMFDPAEWDGKLRFIKRGGTAVGSINGDDLVERDGDAVEREMVQEVELLRKVGVGYLDTAAAWSPNTQAWERTVGTIAARGESIIEVTAVMPANQAATIAKRKGLVSWGEPEKQKLSLLSLRHAKYTPTDILNLTHTDAEVDRIRLMQLEDDSGVRYVESSLNCAEAYNATATGVAPKPPTITDESLRGVTILRAMNLDSLRAQDNVPGMYLAACGIQAGWAGCVVDLSTDGGVSFRNLVTIINPATQGYLADATTTSSEPIKVVLYPGGELSSATTAQVTAGANAAAIVTGGTAELVQFETATATATSAYDLTDVTRGVNDTDPASHLYGDAFVLLDANVVFVPIDVAFAGTTLVFRASAIGTSSDAAATVSVVYEPPTFVIDGGGA